MVVDHDAERLSGALDPSAKLACFLARGSSPPNTRELAKGEN
jgi:hypothetical protein